jgi:hypothetical protein
VIDLILADLWNLLYEAYAVQRAERGGDESGELVSPDQRNPA